MHCNGVGTGTVASIKIELQGIVLSQKKETISTQPTLILMLFFSSLFVIRLWYNMLALPQHLADLIMTRNAVNREEGGYQ